METRANYMLIGAFTVAVVASIFLFVFWFSGTNQQQGSKAYRIIFTGSVAGLTRGGQVLFNGLRVGEVTSIGLMAEDPSRVQAIVTLDPRTPVKTDTHAQLESTVLTGTSSIALTGGGAHTPPLVSTKPGELPVIYADRSEIQNLLAIVQTLSTKLDSILGKVDGLLGENGGTVQATLNNLQVFTKMLADNSAGVGTFLQSAGDLGKSLQPLGPKITSLTSDLDAVVKAADPAKVSTIVANVQDLSKKLNDTAEKLDTLIASAQGIIGSGSSKGAVNNISDAALAIKKLAANLDVRTRDIATGLNRFSNEGLRQYQGLAVDGRRTLDELNRTVQSLQKNPNQLIFGAKPSIPEYPAR
ncbi:MAG: MCE family protein [Hyphomicrobiales bacterium]|nr:MCE family protein [Hyphomicrobiales bacterium]MDE2114322.1 MCE family protein [Hyphomicrobiales bacterium]